MNAAPAAIAAMSSLRAGRPARLLAIVETRLVTNTGAPKAIRTLPRMNPHRPKPCPASIRAPHRSG
jgi:hypothetical protein